ncbi:SnoaL-like domain-containing protein [Chitinophaga sp. YR627]|uniref:nuclear transport factor 2 family protein n=1 Tax=Chitinophaga sp. YR627 TaxID=1881041 RepID=UPI0008E521DB|nr:nuclear transport factor 2 family protein [Chitinophaga sp. YR627]SFM98907.1 SnoaL-like domain-containing protein [Chitinophaga sp. YR627]
MDIRKLIARWIAAANAYDTAQYLDFYLPDAVLDDPSVGRRFEGHKGIGNYFDSYFIGYNTQTALVDVVILDATHAYVEVAFAGDFPEGNIGGTFDLTFKAGKIAFVKADLLH